MHYQFIMQSLCIFSFFWWKLAGIGEYGRALSWKGNAGSQVRNTQQLSAPLWTNERKAKGNPCPSAAGCLWLQSTPWQITKCTWGDLCCGFFFFPKKQKFKIVLELFPVQFVFPKNTAISITKCILKHGCGFLKLLNWNLWKNIGAAKRVVEI